MFSKLGLQIYTCRDFIKDEELADLTLKKIAQAGYTEAHTAGFYGFTAEKFAGMMAKYGIVTIGTHYDYDTIINNPEKTMADHKALGTTNIGIGGCPGWARNTVEGIKRFIDEFNKAAAYYAQYGFKLTYHNHHWEFLRIDGKKSVMDFLYEELDPKNISFVLDTCWVAAACADVREWMEKLAGRIDILHLKDVMLMDDGTRKYGYMTEIGNGQIYWKGVLETAEKIGVKHYVVEQDSNFATGNAFDSIKTSADYLKQYMI